jgi:hypothetical protein
MDSSSSRYQALSALHGSLYIYSVYTSRAKKMASLIYMNTPLEHCLLKDPQGLIVGCRYI